MEFCAVKPAHITTVSNVEVKEYKVFQELRGRPRWLSWMRRPTGDQEVAGSTPAKVGNIFLVKIDREIFSTVTLSLLLIQEGQLSVSGKRMCTILVNRLED